MLISTRDVYNKHSEKAKLTNQFIAILPRLETKTPEISRRLGNSEELLHLINFEWEVSHKQTDEIPNLKRALVCFKEIWYYWIIIRLLRFSHFVEMEWCNSFSTAGHLIFSEHLFFILGPNEIILDVKVRKRFVIFSLLIIYKE